MRAQGAHGFQLSNSCDGRRSTFIVHDNMTVTLNEPGGTHQTAPMTERYGPAGQPGHRSHHVHGLPGPQGSRTGLTSRARRARVPSVSVSVKKGSKCGGIVLARKLSRNQHEANWLGTNMRTKIAPCYTHDILTRSSLFSFLSLQLLKTHVLQPLI